MSPIPPPSPAGSSLPPRHRPTLLSHAQDTTELDLWALDEELEEPQETPQPAEPPPRPSWKDLPAPRERPPQKPHETGDGPLPRSSTSEEHIQINVNKPSMKIRPDGAQLMQQPVKHELDDLEQWDDVPAAPDPEQPPAKTTLTPDEITSPPAETTPAPVEPAEYEFAAVPPPANAVPISLRPHLKLSLVERFGILTLFLLLLAGGAAILVFSLNRLPTEAQRAKANDFPIKGERVTIHSATSYWRAPILTGTSIDTVRRGTQLLPVLEISARGGPAAIRVLFRNEDRAVVGDAVTRMLDGETTLEIPATAGFDDLGMHAAYRTGESKPWTIEVLEAPTANAAGTTFKRLFEMNISTDRR